MSDITTEKLSNKLDYIDAWRGIAIILVIMTHSSHFDISKDIGIGFVDTIIWFGGHGVTLFFVLSAFTIFYSVQNAGLNTKSEIFYFFIRRFFRIAPMYYIGIIFYKFIFAKDYTINAGLFENILFIHWIDPRYYDSNQIMPGGWSITTEFAFYMLVPILFRYITSLNKAITAFLLSIVVSKILRAIMHRVYPLADELYFRLNPTNLLPVFFVGIILYFIIIKKDKYNFDVFHLIFLSILIFWQVEFGFIMQEHYYIALMFGLLILGTSARIYKMFNNEALKLIGRVSFSLYVSHFFVLWLLRDNHLTTFTGNNLVDCVIRMLLTFSGGFVLSYPLYHLVEKPFIKMGKQIINKQKSPALTSIPQ